MRPRTLADTDEDSFNNVYMGGDGDDSVETTGYDLIIGGGGFNSAYLPTPLFGYTFSETPNGLIVYGANGNVVTTLIQIQHVAGHNGGPFGFDGQFTDDQFGDVHTTGAINPGQTISGAMQFVGDHDWYRVTLTAGHHYVINEFGQDSDTPFIKFYPTSQIYSASSVLLASDHNGGFGHDSQLGVVAGTSGTYYIDAGGGNSSELSGPVPYRIELIDLGTSDDRFSLPSLASTSFVPSQGWTSQNLYSRALANLNGDDAQDIIAFGVSGVFGSLSHGSGFDAPTVLISNNFGTSQNWTSQESFPRLVADVNGDGSVDIVGFGIAGTYVALSSNSSFSTTFVLANYGANQGWSSENTYVRELSDVNGDGKADIVAFGVAGTYVSLANNSGGFNNPDFVLAQFGTSQGWSSQDQYPRQLADVNGDGKADIVGFGAAGVFVSLATAGGNFGSPTQELSDFALTDGWTNNNTYPRLVGDINADGVADIVGFGSNGIYVSLATGNGHFASPILTGHDMGTATGWSSEDAYPRLLGDVTGDGRADVVGFGIGDVYVSQSHHDWIVV